MKNILILNGSPSGPRGNCAAWIDWLKKSSREITCEVVHLSEKKFGAALKKKIEKSDALIFVTGTYWDSWGSPLQALLEAMTEMEATHALLGKPAAVFVLMHSVGGKGVLSRLQGVLSTLGFLIPPMSGMVYALATDLALKKQSPFAKDFWQKEDVPLILKNLIIACDHRPAWQSWPVDKKDPTRKWLKIAPARKTRGG